jgi:hypothetical protein
VLRIQLVTLGQELQDQRRRRQGEREACDESGVHRQAQQMCDGREHDCSNGDLRQAKPENRAAQRPQARGLQLEANDEQQQHHAELGEVHHAFDVVDHRQAERTDHQARGQITEDGAQPQPTEQGHRQHGGAQKHGNLSCQCHATLMWMVPAMCSKKSR